MTQQHQAIVKYLVSEGFVATEAGVFVKIINSKPVLIEYITIDTGYFCDTVGYNNYYFTLDGIREFIDSI